MARARSLECFPQAATCLLLGLKNYRKEAIGNALPIMRGERYRLCVAKVGPMGLALAIMRGKSRFTAGFSADSVERRTPCYKLLLNSSNEVKDGRAPANRQTQGTP